MIRQEFVGNARTTALAANVSTSATSFTVSNGSSFPSGSNNPFVVSIGRGTDSEEKILCSSRSSDSFLILQRGYDGTTNVAHVAGESVDHVLDATVIQDMNTTVYDSEILNWMGV